MVALITLAAVCVALCLGLRVLVAGIALLVGIVLIARYRRASRPLLAGPQSALLTYASRPSRAQRRLMRRHLRLAISLTELRSLLPNTVEQAERCVDRWTGTAIRV